MATLMQPYLYTATIYMSHQLNTRHACNDSHCDKALTSPRQRRRHQQKPARVLEDDRTSHLGEAVVVVANEAVGILDVAIGGRDRG